VSRATRAALPSQAPMSGGTAALVTIAPVPARLRAQLRAKHRMPQPIATSCVSGLEWGEVSHPGAEALDVIRKEDEDGTA
jgi:hypothetical protein